MINTLARFYKKPMLFVVDLLLLNMAFVASFLLRFDGIWLRYFDITYLLILSFLSILILYFSKLYNKMWRYASIAELYSIIKVSALINILFVIYIFFNQVNFPRSILIINGILDVFLLGGLRFFIRFLKEHLNRSMTDKASKNVLIIGAGDAADMIIREMQKHPELDKRIVGLIDDDPDKVDLEIHGIKVVGNRHDIPRIIDKQDIEEVIIAIPSTGGKNIKDIYNLSNRNEVTIKIIPGMYELLNGNVNLNQLREVKVEDLLRRDPINLNNEKISSYLKDRTVLITGGGGSIGSEICKQVARFEPSRLILFDIYENNMYFLELELKDEYPGIEVFSVVGSIRDQDKLRYTFAKFQPDVVFHAAAHKHVPLMENNPEEAVKNNILGTRNLVEIADNYAVERFVLISTDKAVNPTNVMGASKRVAEMILQINNKGSQTKFMAVRFGNVLGSSGSVIPRFKKQIKNRQPVTVTHPEVIRYFMTIPEAAQLVIQTGALGQGGEVFVLDMGEPVKIYDLAKDLIKLSGLKPGEDIDIEITGLRPGEKLYEELLYNEENIATGHENIFITQLEVVKKERLYQALYKLEELVEAADVSGIIDCLVNLVETYEPKRDNVKEVVFNQDYLAEQKKKADSIKKQEAEVASSEES